jgi:predicted dehydrogenase
MMSKVRVAVLGYGHLGKWHCQKVEACAEVAEFVAIVEKTPAGLQAAMTNHPKVKVVADLKEILSEIDAAFIVTPTSTHFELVKALLENGKHVFCEKPLCSNDQEGQALSDIARASSLCLQVGHSERFHAAWEILKEDFQNLPSPYLVKINRVAAFKGRATDVDVVQDLGIHDLDLLAWLFKDRPRSVKAFGHKIRTNKWDSVTIDVAMENGSQALITVGRNHVKEVRELEVVSKRGLLHVDLFSNKLSRAHHAHFDDGSFVQEMAYPKRDHLLLEHQAFYRAILEQRLPPVGLTDGLFAVHLVDCVLQALDEGREISVKM